MSLYEQILVDAGAAPGGRPPRPSGSVVPWRRSADGALEVFLVRRAPGVPFMARWHAFPGGGIARRDAEVRLLGRPRGLVPGAFTTPLPGEGIEELRDGLGPDLFPGLVAGVLRELFEETGILLEEGEAPARDPARLVELRHRLVDREVEFASLAETEDWRLDASELVFAGRWLTPPLAPLRYDNRFFLLAWPADRPLQPRVLGRELDHGEWIPPSGALAAWRRGEILAAPPILHLLRVLSGDGPVEGLARLLAPTEVDLGPMRRIEFRPGILLLPLRTATLPPATHTHAFLLGRDPAVLVDPGCHADEETRRLLAVLRAFEDEGGRLVEIWLTHHHPDHVGAVEAVRRAFCVPVRAHRATGEALASRGLAIDGELRDDELVELGGDPALRIRVLHTPGHARGHLAFHEQTTGSLLAGDLVSALSTIVIDPPDGDMDAYLDSLQRVLDLEPRTVFPAHGPVLLGADRIRQTRRHRLDRERQIAASWAEGIREVGELTESVYSEVPGAFLPLAQRQVLAHLRRLERLGALVG